MPTFVRCKLCGQDHPYREGIEQMQCENCETPLDKENTRYFATPRVTRQADPLADT